MKRIAGAAADEVLVEYKMGDVVPPAYVPREPAAPAYANVYGFPRPAFLREVSTTAAGDGLPVDVVRRHVRVNYGRIRLCYENELRNDPDLEGTARIHFVIGKDGSVVSARDEGSSLPSAAVARCIARGFMAVRFPAPVDGRDVSVSTTVHLAWGP